MEKLDNLRKLFSQVNTPFGNKPAFAIVDFADEINRFITYGFIRGAKVFIVGKTKFSPMCWEDYGWALEHIILNATGMNLGTCWLGGTFDGATFAQKIDLQNDEIIPAVCPIGYPTEARSLRDKAIRWIAGSHKRKEWESLFFHADFATPLSRNSDDYSIPLLMLRLAPSASNRQPWRVIRHHDTFHFYLQRTPGYKKLMQSDLQRIDMGIAMLHFDYTSRELGIPGTWQVCNPNLPDAPEGIEYIATWER